VRAALENPLARAALEAELAKQPHAKLVHDASTIQRPLVVRSELPTNPNNSTP
jgi:hypothetical protein